jgi:uncharacterized repeat protein (TIGR03803 family)
MKNCHRRIAGIVLVVAFGFAICARAVDKEIILHRFNPSTGEFGPAGKLLMDKAGNLYGAAAEGGANGRGVIFELSPSSGGGWSYKVIYTFLGVTGDGGPTGSLLMDSAGNLYGTANAYAGEIFELSPNGTGGWTETVLYTISQNDGLSVSPVVMDGAGNLYGTVAYGPGYNGVGFVFKEGRNTDGVWQFQVLFEFGEADGAQPWGGVIVDASGNLYGTTALGGTSTNCANGCGVVYALTESSQGMWNEKVIHQFTGTNGSDPQGSLMMDAAGNLYGTTQTGGSKGFGIVFKLTKTGSGWKSSALRAFTDANGDGAIPNTELVMMNGNLYGTTDSGGGGQSLCGKWGAEGCGEAFELSPAGSLWHKVTLHNFTGGSDGEYPQGLIVDANGNAYGMTHAGNPDLNDDVIFELKP